MSDCSEVIFLGQYIKTDKILISAAEQAVYTLKNTKCVKNAQGNIRLIQGLHTSHSNM